MLSEDAHAVLAAVWLMIWWWWGDMACFLKAVALLIYLF